MALFNHSSIDLPASFSKNDWSTKQAILKSLYNEEMIFLKYIDDENEQVGIKNQEDFDYALRMAKHSGEKYLKLVLLNNKYQVIGQPRLVIDYGLRNEQTEQISEKECEKLEFSSNQIKWLNSYLQNFKKEVFNEVEKRLSSKSIVKQSDFLFDFDDLLNNTMDEESFQFKLKKLFNHLMDARTTNRILKAAYIEEELHSTGAFNAEFLKDCNIPDGYKCEPKTKFIKTWLMKNTGKIEWNSENYPVKLVCIGGNISTANQIDHILVPHTKVNETASISVDLVAPHEPGTYFSEWVLSCYGFYFGPRIWCTITVHDSEHNKSNVDSNNNRENQDTPSDYSNLPKKDIIHSTVNDMFLLKSCNLETKGRSVGVSPIEVVEDCDDNEFVVIPDCFNLSKKWKPRNEREKENDMTIVNYEFTNDESNGLIFNGNIETHEEESKQNDKELQTVKLENLIKLDDNDDNDYIKQQNVEQHIMSTNKLENSSLSTFNMMKDAFLNLRGPSYVAGFDLVNEKQLNQFEHEKQHEHISHIVNLNTKNNKQQKQESPMEKLVSMGFANRTLNDRLLKKYNHDMEKVIKDLLERITQ